MIIGADILSSAMMKQIDRSAESAAGMARAKILHNKNNVPEDLEQKADKTAKDFESLFITQMLEQMFGESVGTELFGDEESSDVYRQLMVEQYGKKISDSGGIGIADYVKRELLKIQEV